MKKITLLLAGLMVSGMVSAVELTASGTVTMVDCPLLNEDVKLNLTKDVHAGVSCNAAAVAMSACHTAGKVTQRTVPLKPDTTAGAAAGSMVSCTVGTSDPTCANTPVTGPAMPTANTLAGTVNSQYPGGGTCTAAGAAANATKQLPVIPAT